MTATARGRVSLALIVLTLMALAPGALLADVAEDDRVRQRIEMRLSGQVALRVDELAIEVVDGVAHLRGKAASLGDRLRLERLVGGIVGVRALENEVTIEPTDRSGLDIAQDVSIRLANYPRYRTNPPQVSVSGTEVTLSGTVDRALDRLDAETFASFAPGVTKVINNLQVRSEGAHTPESIRKRVLSILTNPLTFGVIRDLDVQVDQGAVILRGVVAREADRAEAQRLALGVPGVTGVIDLLVVAGRS